MSELRCNRCHRPMKGTTGYDGACACGGLIETIPMINETFPGIEGLRPTSRAPRPRDEVWDALAALFGEPTTRSNRTLRNKIVISLKEAGADYADIIARSVTWPAHFPGATLTETALEVHWDRLGRPPLRATELQAREYEQDEDRRRLEAWASEEAPDESQHRVDRGE